MRPGGMAAATFDLNIEIVGGRHDRPDAHGEFARCKPRQIVHAEKLLDAETLDEPVVDHRLGAAPPSSAG